MCKLMERLSKRVLLAFVISRFVVTKVHCILILKSKVLGVPDFRTPTVHMLPFSW